MNERTKKRLLYSILILSIVGLLTSLYLVKDHYSVDASFCDFNAQISCSLVNTSVYSEIFNVPVAVFGALWFLILIALSWRALTKDGVLLSSLLGWNVFGILFVVYLVVAEIILQAVCPFCTVVHIIVITTFILSIILYQNQKTKLPWERIILGMKSWIAVIIILNVIPVVAFNISLGEKENYDELAKCITTNGVKMYGSFRCGVCAKTRAMFGDSFRYIKEIECHPQGENPQTALCLEKGIAGTPTWIMEVDGVEQKRHQGFLSIEELRQFSGCTE